VLCATILAKLIRDEHLTQSNQVHRLSDDL
jgi:hypothetical protein